MMKHINIRVEKPILKLNKDFFIQQKLYQNLNKRKYFKVFNKYKITNITLENFGLSLGKHLVAMIPRVGSNENMGGGTPDENKEKEADAPFCCTHCRSRNYIKYGKKNKKQVYKCKDCNRKFVDNLYFEKMKADYRIICKTLDLYFKGLSYRKIADHFKQFYDLKVHFTTVFNWIKKYIEIMDNYVSKFKPSLGIAWQADEMMIKIKGKWRYLWNVMNKETRFQLASVISEERKVMNARRVLQVAKKCSFGDKPMFIVTDGLSTYNKAINKEFYTVKKETTHISNVGIQGSTKTIWGRFDNNIIERLHGTIKGRNKTQRGLKSEETAFVKGHRLYYNFIRPHMSLNGYTPAHWANIYLGLGDKKWENLLMQSIKNQRNSS